MSSNTDIEELRKAIRNDFHSLLVKEFTADWKIQRLVHDCEIDVMDFDNVNKFIQQKVIEVQKVTGDTSDGYHTFNELYNFRKAYNALLFNEWFRQGKYGVHKSYRHSDGELCFGGGWFVVSAQTPTGQITNHYENKDWYMFICEEREKPAEWDGHTSQDALERLTKLAQLNHNKKGDSK